MNLAFVKRLFSGRRNRIIGGTALLVVVAVVVVGAVATHGDKTDAAASPHTATSTPTPTPQPCGEPATTDAARFVGSPVIQLPSPKLCVATSAASVAYSIKNVDGTVVGQGSAPVKAGAAYLSFPAPGYYTVSATAGPTKLATTVMVVDRVASGQPALVSNLGVAAHPGSARNGDIVRYQKDVGASMVRYDMLWSQVEKTKGHYVFPAAYTKLADDVHKSGGQLLPIIDYGNKLYDGGKVPSSSEGIAAFAAYAAAVVKKFHPAAIEVMNEFNNAPLNDSACGLTPECYLPMLKATYQAVKAADPKVLVVGAVTAKEDDAWIGHLLELGGGQYLDVISTHPYNALLPPETYYDTAFPATEAMIRQKAGKDIPLWVTEGGWPSPGKRDQGDLLVRGITMAYAAGVQRYVWYDLIDDKIGPGVWPGEGQMGLFSVTSANQIVPKPSAYALLEFGRQLGGKPLVKKDDTAKPVYSYEFGTDAAPTRVIWATASTPITLTTDKPVTVTGDLGGRTVMAPQNGVVKLTATASPVYVSGAVSSVAVG